MLLRYPLRVFFLCRVHRLYPHCWCFSSINNLNLNLNLKTSTLPQEHPFVSQKWMLLSAHIWHFICKQKYHTYLEVNKGLLFRGMAAYSQLSPLRFEIAEWKCVVFLPLSTSFRHWSPFWSLFLFFSAFFFLQFLPFFVCLYCFVFAFDFSESCLWVKRQEAHWVTGLQIQPRTWITYEHTLVYMCLCRITVRCITPWIYLFLTAPQHIHSHLVHVTLACWAP